MDFGHGTARSVRTLLSFALLLIVVAGTGGGAAPAGPLDDPVSATSTPDIVDTPSTTAALLSPDDLEELLLDSLVLDGDAGYFVDDAWSSTRSPFSLPATYWQLRLRHGVLPTGMQKARLAPWLAIGAVGGLASSELAQLDQIVLATGIADQLDLALDRAAIGAKLQLLRDGDRYAADPGEGGTWAATANAVRILRDLAQPVPAGTVQRARRELAQLPAELDTPAVLATVLPLLEVAVLGGPQYENRPAGQRYDPALLRLASRAQATLRTAATATMDSRWLDGWYRIEAVSSALGGPHQQLPGAGCDVLAGRAAGALTLTTGAPALPDDEPVPLADVSQTDPQRIFYLREFGCPGWDATPDSPHTRAGWLLASAGDMYQTLGATSAALRIAETIHSDRLEDFRARVGGAVTTYWLPLVTDPAMPAPARAVAATRLLPIATAAGLDSRRLVRAVDEAATGAPAGSLTSLIAAASGDQAARRSAATAVLDHPVSAGQPASIDTAAVLTLAGTYLHDQKMLDTADQLTARLRLAEGVYTNAECARDQQECRADQPFIAASAVGSWISRTPVAPLFQWQAHGLCQGYVCSDRTSDPTLLRQIHLALQCARPACGQRFPLIL